MCDGRAVLRQGAETAMACWWLLLMLLLLLLLLLVGAWLWHGSERVGREVAHVDGIVRAVLHICGMFRRGSRECSDGM